MEISASAQLTSGNWQSLTSHQLFSRKRKAQKHKHLWKLVWDLPNSLKNHSSRLAPDFRKVELEAKLTYSLDSIKTETTSTLILQPPKLAPFGPQLQITTSTKKPMLGSNIILHVRSNFNLNDFHCVVTSRGRLLTTRLISMGHTKLKTFDEIVTFNMAPEATFMVWHVDNWGRMVTASVTVPIFANFGGHLDAHPVLEASSGYTQLTLSGEANSLIMLNAINEHAYKSVMEDNPYEEVMQETIVSHSNGLGFGNNLMVMSDTKNGLKDEDKLQCLEKGRFQCGQLCYHFLDICDHRCQCLDCQDEIDCGGGEMSLEATSTPVLKSQKSNGFWRVVKVSIPRQGGPGVQVCFWIPLL